MSIDTPLISIITPTFNSEKYVMDLINNVQQQDFKNFEHIIMDGLSSDRTADLVLSACEVYSNLKLVSEPDAGIYDAMNKGVRISQGKWIFFLGSDDWFTEKDVLLKIENAINDSPHAELIYGDVWSEVYNRIYEGQFQINKILGQNICHQCMFFRKELFYKMGEYELKYKQNADYQFNLLAWLGGRVIHKYYPITVCVFAKGGVSSILGDKLHAHDYPSVIVNTTLLGNWSFLRKIEILSQCLRKVLIRYPLNVFFTLLFDQRKNLPVKLAATAWMVITFPYYIIKVSLKNL